MAKLTMNCPHCGGDIELPATVVHSNGQTAQVLVKVDQSVGEAHLRECRQGRGAADPVALGPSKAELSGRIHRMLATGAFIATGGSRACTMCGTNGQDCNVRLEKRGTACCAACHNGNTHPGA